jgi:hypothetical protein
MYREVALRRALDDARGRRAQELEDLVERQRALRRRLRELQDRELALGTVHGRFAATPPAPPPEGRAPAEESASTVATLAPSQPAPLASPLLEARVVLTPPRRDEETYAALLLELHARFPDGFTVSQMREVMDATDPDKAHSYDGAWSLANNLHRSRALELAGTKLGPTGVPIRVYRIHAKATSEVR